VGRMEELCTRNSARQPRDALKVALPTYARNDWSEGPTSTRNVPGLSRLRLVSDLEGSVRGRRPKRLAVTIYGC
jgi:hypothetical protein